MHGAKEAEAKRVAEEHNRAQQAAAQRRAEVAPPTRYKVPPAGSIQPPPQGPVQEAMVPKQPPSKAALLEHLVQQEGQKDFFRNLKMPAAGPPPAGAQPASSEESGLSAALEEVRAKKAAA